MRVFVKNGYLILGEPDNVAEMVFLETCGTIVKQTKESDSKVPSIIEFEVSQLSAANDTTHVCLKPIIPPEFMDIVRSMAKLPSAPTYPIPDPTDALARL
jgi:hypothetical protein